MKTTRIKFVHKFVSLLILGSVLLTACAQQTVTPTAISQPTTVSPTQASAQAVPTGAATTPASNETCLTVGIIHVGAITDAGYNEAEHDGVQEMAKNIPCVKVLEAENIPETPDVERIMQNMIQQGAKFIIPASFGYQDYALEVAAKYPDVKFEFPSGYKPAANLGDFWAQSNDAFYLLGMAAAKMTKSNKLGFVASQPISIVFANVNAFELGAQTVNPKIETHIVFTGSWSDPAKEATATNALIDQGIDVVSMVVDSPITVVQTAEKRGAYSIGYHSDSVAKFAPKYWISGIAFTWGPFFTREAKAIMDGSWKSESVMGDLNSDMVKLADFGPNVPADVQQLVAQKKADITSGNLSIFKGPISDQASTLRVKEGEVLTADQLNTMDWMVSGIIGQAK